MGSGTIAERASDFDGYTGVIPKTSATIAEVLQHYGYKTAAFGKWHNTPANQTTTLLGLLEVRHYSATGFPKEEEIGVLPSRFLENSGHCA